MSAADWIVIFVLAAAVGLAVYFSLRYKRSCCKGKCAECAMRCEFSGVRRDKKADKLKRKQGKSKDE